MEYFFEILAEFGLAGIIPRDIFEETSNEGNFQESSFMTVLFFMIDGWRSFGFTGLAVLYAACVERWMFYMSVQ